MQDARVRAALLALCLACLIGSAIVLYAGHRPQTPPMVITPPAVGIVSGTATKRATRLYVDVAGAVRRPSLYALPPGSRVMQAIRTAGGPTAEADMDAVNLAQKVTDGEKIEVPKRSLAPSIVPLIISDSASQQPSGKSEKAGKGSHSNKLTAASGEQIGLNSATAEELQRLPGVGPSMSARILAYRQQSGGFQKPEDLMQVTGIGPKKFAKIAPFVKLD